MTEPLEPDELECRRYKVWQLGQALIDHAEDYASGPATPETTGAIVDEAAALEAEVIALAPHLRANDPEIARALRIVEALKNILRGGHEAEPGTALITDYMTDDYSPN